MKASFGFAIVAGAFPLYLLWEGRLGRYLGFAIAGGSSGAAGAAQAAQAASVTTPGTLGGTAGAAASGFQANPGGWLP